jgi:hypothetical protein
VSESEALDRLRARYEAQGFAFTVHPTRTMLPEFLRGYTPDAIACKPGENVAIEVMRQQKGRLEGRLQAIRDLFEGQPDWKLSIFHTGSDQSSLAAIPVVQPEAIRGRLSDVRALVQQGQYGAALMIAWSLLEAASRLAEAQEGPPRSAGTVVQSLAMRGAISPETEQRLRGQIALRNRIVHGDIAAEPQRSDVESLLAALGEALEIAAA